LEKGSEVITTTFTFVSNTHAIARNGFVPVFCDIDENNYTIDVNKLEQLITDKTSAIVPVHVYGNVCNVDEIEKIAKKHNLKVVYDAAHAFGVTIGGKGIATFGDAAMFSFHATKVFHTIEGGCVALKKSEDVLRFYQLSNFGIMGEDKVAFVGANAKMNEFQAAMGLCNLDHIDENIKKRKDIYEMYEKEFSSIEGISMLKPYRDDVVRNYAYCPVFFDENILGKTRDDLYDFLSSKNVYSRKYFFPITSEFDCYKDMAYKANTEVAKQMSKRVLTLPIYPELAKEDVEMICSLIKDYFGL
jgi:dTDP-4-amino-4,6-dideoxygalactose transaminase